MTAQTNNFCHGTDSVLMSEPGVYGADTIGIASYRSRIDPTNYDWKHKYEIRVRQSARAEAKLH
jgi:hypothetical protein